MFAGTFSDHNRLDRLDGSAPLLGETLELRDKRTQDGFDGLFRRVYGLGRRVSDDQVVVIAVVVAARRGRLKHVLQRIKPQRRVVGRRRQVREDAVRQQCGCRHDRFQPLNVESFARPPQHALTRSVVWEGPNDAGNGSHRLEFASQ